MDSREFCLSFEQLDQSQAFISKKKGFNAYSVERDYVNSRAFHDKFEKLPLSHEVQQSVYREIGRLLEFVDGQEDERLVVVNSRTDNLDRVFSGSIEGTGLNKEEYDKITMCRDSVVVIHNHSLNGPPSGRDLITYNEDSHVRISLIACHNGDLYAIYEVRDEFREVYEEYLELQKRKFTDVKDAQRIAMTRLYADNDTFNEKDKLFKVVKL